MTTAELTLDKAGTEVAEAEAPIRVFFRRLMRHRSGQVGLVGVIGIFAVAIIGPFLIHTSPTAVVAGQKLIGPSLAFPFGTDQLGRDVLTRVVYGAQLSLTLGLVPVAIAAAIGVPIGVLVGYAPRVDLILMRVMDVMMAIPALVFALAVIAILGPGLTNVMLALGIAWIPYYVRMARGNVKRARGNGYVEYAIATGATDFRIMFVHLLQSVAAPVIVMITIGIGDAILSGSALSFIGLGAPPPTPEWGAILRDGREFLRIAWWISVFPGIAIVFTVVSFNLLGDALRDTLDPRVRRGGLTIETRPMDGSGVRASSVRWSDLSWPQIDALDRDRTVLLLPTGAIEQHGPHLPVDTDIHDADTLSVRAAVAAGVRTVVLPPVSWGMSPHHMGYPGTISLTLETYSALIRDICASVASHGFRRVLIVNGHGGNVAILGATLLRMSEELRLFVGAVSYWQLIVPQLREIGTSGPGGMGHACEMETSLQLHLRPELVSMADARADMRQPMTAFNAIDFRDPGPLAIALDFRRDSTEGVMGDPTAANSEKGSAIADAAIGELVRVIEAFATAPLDGQNDATGFDS